MTPLDAVLEQLAARVADLVIERLGTQATATPTAAPLMTKQVLAGALGTSTATIDRLTRDGRIPFIRVGDVRRYDLAAVRAALAAPTEATTTPAAAPGGVRLLSRARGAR